MIARASARRACGRDRAVRDGHRPLDLAALEAALLGDDVACVYLENPDFLGVLETEAPAIIGGRARRGGARASSASTRSRWACWRRRRATAPTSSAASCSRSASTQHFGGGRGGLHRDARRGALRRASTRRSCSASRDHGAGRVRLRRGRLGADSYVQRGDAQDFTGTTQDLWAIAAAVVPLAARARTGWRSWARASCSARAYAAQRLAEVAGRARARLAGTPFKEVVVSLDGTGRAVPTSTGRCAARASSAARDLTAHFPGSGRALLVSVTEVAHAGGHRPARRRARGGDGLRRRRMATDRAPRCALPPGDAGTSRWSSSCRRPASAASCRRPSSRGSPRPRATSSPAAAGRACAAATPPALPELAQAARAAPLPAAVAGDAGRGGRHPPRARHVHDEVQPARQRGADPRAAGRRPAPAARTTRRCRGCWSATDASSGSCARSRASTASVPARRRLGQAVYANARMIRADHARPRRGRSATRSSRRSSRTRATPPRPATVGFKLVTLYPGRTRLPGARRVQGGAVNERTAGLMITNPEDTGSSTRTSTASSSSCTRPAASATTTRPTPTASSASRGPATPASTSASSTCTRRSRRRTAPWACPCGASGVTAELARFLPAPTVEYDGERYYLDHDRPGLHRQAARLPRRARRRWCARWRGCWRSAPRACARSPRSAVLNNNYLARKAGRDRRHRGLVRRRQRRRRLEQIRYTLARAHRGDGRDDRSTWPRRRATSGSRQYFPSHEPWLVPGADDAGAGRVGLARRPRRVRRGARAVARQAHEDPDTTTTAARKHRPQARHRARWTTRSAGR